MAYFDARIVNMSTLRNRSREIAYILNETVVYRRVDVHFSVLYISDTDATGHL